MKPVEFPEHNVKIAESQKEYRTLPAYSDDTTDQRHMICCWKLSFRERIKLLFTGKLWLSVMRFRDHHGVTNPLQPLLPSVHKWDLLNKEYYTKKPKKRELNG